MDSNLLRQLLLDVENGTISSDEALDKLAEAVKELKAVPVQQASQLDTMKLIEGIANAARSLAPPSLPPAPAQPDLEKQLALIEKVVNVGTRIIDARGGSEDGPADSGDVYAITCGEPMGAPGGTNMLKICRVA